MATEIKEVKERVSTLEKTLEDFIRHTNLGFAKVQNAMIEQKQSLILQRGQSTLFIALNNDVTIAL